MTNATLIATELQTSKGTTIENRIVMGHPGLAELSGELEQVTFEQLGLVNAFLVDGSVLIKVSSKKAVDLVKSPSPHWTKIRISAKQLVIPLDLNILTMVSNVRPKP